MQQCSKWRSLNFVRPTAAKSSGIVQNVLGCKYNKKENDSQGRRRRRENWQKWTQQFLIHVDILAPWITGLTQLQLRIERKVILQASYRPDFLKSSPHLTRSQNTVI